MIKLKNSLQIKKFLRIALIVVIIIQLILVTIQLYEYLNKLVFLGVSTSTASTEGNYFIRFLNFFEIGVGSLIKENVLNICLPLLVYVLLRDRDREILYGEEITEAVKEGVIEGVDEVTSPTHIKPVTKTDVITPTIITKDNQIEDDFIIDEVKENTIKEDVKEVEQKSNTDINNLDDFFSKLK